MVSTTFTDLDSPKDNAARDPAEARRRAIHELSTRTIERLNRAQLFADAEEAFPKKPMTEHIKIINSIGIGDTQATYRNPGNEATTNTIDVALGAVIGGTLIAASLKGIFDEAIEKAMVPAVENEQRIDDLILSHQALSTLEDRAEQLVNQELNHEAGMEDPEL